MKILPNNQIEVTITIDSMPLKNLPFPIISSYHDIHDVWKDGHEDINYCIIYHPSPIILSQIKNFPLIHPFYIDVSINFKTFPYFYIPYSEYVQLRKLGLGKKWLYTTKNHKRKDCVTMNDFQNEFPTPFIHP